jgi:hypothetical protein
MAAHLPLFAFPESERMDRKGVIQRPFAEIIPTHPALEPALNVSAKAFPRRSQ